MTISAYLSRHPRRVLAGAIILTTTSSLIAYAAWASSYDWRLSFTSLYSIFPLLGLLAFTIMWSQYIMEAVQNLTRHTADIRRFFTTTSAMVLVLILLHPGLLIMQRYIDGYGLPPGSYESYVAPAKAWLTILGSISLLVFLAFEFKRFFGNRAWWPAVLILNDVAIIAIYYHALQLGTQLQSGWFKDLWMFYGLTLLVALVYKYYLKITGRVSLKA